MKIYNPSGFDSKLTGSFTGSFKGDGSNITSISSDNVIFNFTAISSSQQIASDVTGSFTSLSSSLESRISDNESFSSSLDATYATDAELAAVSASLASELLKNTTDTLDGDLTVTGTLTAQEFHTELVSASILFDSGSTKFGDSIDDIHQFTGSLKVSSSIYTTSQTFTPQDTTINTTNTSINSTYITVGNNTSDNVYIGGSTLNTIGGKVGIGTTTLNALLTISGSANQNSTNPGISLTNSHSSQTVLYIENGTTRGYELAVGGSSNSVDPGSFYIYDGTAAAARFIIDSSGDATFGGSITAASNTFKCELDGSGNTLLDLKSTGSQQIRFFDTNSSYTEAMRILRYDDKLSITYGDNANEEALTVVGTGSTVGNVGIGTTSPDGQLTVKGTTQIVTTDLNANTEVGLSIMGLHTTDNVGITVGKANSTKNSGVFRYHHNTDGGNDNYVGIGHYAADDILNITSGGSVGIGTTTPLADLHVNNQSSDAQVLVQGANKMALHQDAAWNSNILLGCYYDGSNVVYGTANRGAFKIVGLHDSPSQPQTLSIYGANGGASAGATVTFNTVGFSQDEDGNVAIGTTTPRVKLDVRGNASIGNIGTPFNDAYTTAFDSLQVGDGTVIWGRAADSHFSGNYYVKNVSNVAQDTYINTLPAQDLWLDNGSGDLKYRSAASGTAGTQVSLTTRFTITNSGVVKIGAADDTPAGTQFALAVKGDGNRVAYFDGNTAASVWWGIGNTPQFAIDSITGGGATFWTHVSGTWKERMRITSLGAIEIAGAGTTVNGNAFITNTNSLATFGSTQSSGVPKDMAFFNGSERLRIQATTGNVGIGTNNPTSLLHLRKATGDPMINIQAVASGDPGITFTSINNRTGNIFYSDGTTNAMLRYDHADVSFKLYAHNTTVADFVLNETTAYFPSQNVGIGTTSPDITGFGWNALTIVGGTTAGSAGILELGAPSTDANNQNYGIIAFMGGTARNAQIAANRDNATNDGRLSFWTSPGSGGIVERMRISSDGMVGIGTSDFSDMTWGSPVIKIKGSRAGLGLYSTGSLATISMTASSSASTAVHLNLEGSTGDLSLYHYAAGGETVRFKGTGNIGIGTTSTNGRVDIRGVSGSPATSGTAQNGILRIQNASNNNTLDIGQPTGTPYGTWLQAADKSDLNPIYTYPLSLNPNGGNVGIGTTNPIPKFHLTYSNGSYGTDATSGFINQATTGRATQRIRSITDNPAELFFDINGGIRWDISVRDSSGSYDMHFYRQGGTPGYNTVSNPSLTLKQNGDVYMPVGNVGIGVTTTSYKLEVSGGFAATAITETSALKFKENITPLNSQLEIINKLNPVNFDWKEDGKKDFGFIADEVEEIIPELVSYKDDEVHGLHYSKLTPILVKALQEQQTQIEELKQEIKKLKEI